MKSTVSALFAGLIFGVGLAVGGMTQPSKVVGFLDITGNWDPSLAFVMGGAIAVFLPLFRLISKRSKPLWSAYFAVPTRRDLDARLIVGSGIFGIGWALAGYCPGPALTSAGTLAPNALLFTGSMIFGFGLKRVFDAWRSRSKTSEPASVSRPALSK